MTRRVGILGGTFDPVHNAHLAIARAALARLGLERILWLPTGAPGYRQPPLAPAADRVAMLKLALADEPRFAIDERELRAGASGFTFDSISSLKREYPQSQFVLLMGSDQYEKRATWHRWDELEKLCAIAVASRPGSQAGHSAESLPIEPSPVSASDIRARVGRDEDISAMVPAPVLAYIRRKGLYR
ncbi:MAG: nicotinate (nicotinamide) nucleotide adenylyltransferase [Burkholderiales bacterium]|nr:nicotinate (nicotinamide) nucleotide adenylyltransferase [Burkholderiales bacterium]